MTTFFIMVGVFCVGFLLAVLTGSKVVGIVFVLVGWAALFGWIWYSVVTVTTREVKAANQRARDEDRDDAG